MKFEEAEEALSEVKKLTTVDSKIKTKKTIYYKPKSVKQINITINTGKTYEINTEEITLMSLCNKGLNIQKEKNYDITFLPIEMKEISNIKVVK